MREIRFIWAWNSLHLSVKFASFEREIRLICAWNSLNLCVKFASFEREIRFIRAWNSLNLHVKYASFASFAREICLIRTWNSLHIRRKYCLGFSASTRNHVTARASSCLVHAPRNSRYSRRLILANSAAGLSIASLHCLWSSVFVWCVGSGRLDSHWWWRVLHRAAGERPAGGGGQRSCPRGVPKVGHQKGQGWEARWPPQWR